MIIARSARGVAVACGLVAALGLACVDGACAQEFPSKVVHIVVPTEAGGTVDLVGRLVARKLAEMWKQSVIVENRAGAGGVIGAEYVANAAPDGHVLGLMTTSFTANAATSKNLPYDVRRDFVPVALVAFSTYILVANPSLPVTSVKELIGYAKQNPGKIAYASAGNGGSLHLATEMLSGMAGIKMLHVPYKGTVPAARDTLAGVVQVTISSLAAAMPHVSAGKLRLLAVTGSSRSLILPDTPTIGETVPGYEFNNWFGLVAPKGTSGEVVGRIHTAVARVLQDKEVREWMLGKIVEPSGLGPDRFGAMMRAEIDNYSRLVAEIGVQLK